MRTVTEITRRQKRLFLATRLKVCAYVRVSTDSREQLSSLENQTQHYESSISSNPDYQYCGIFSDASISGAKENRPGFLAMMEKARSGEIDLIITKSISRFARNTLLLLRYVRELRDIGVGIIFEEEKVHTLKAEGELLLTVMGAIAEEERKSVGSNVQWSKRNRFKQGKAKVNTNRLLGYDTDQQGHVVIDHEQADIIREIYRRYLVGGTSYEIAKAFREEGIPSYSKHPWGQPRIISILSNEKYCGDLLMQKSYVDINGNLKKNRGELPQYYIQDNHPAIISREDWEKAQQIRAARANAYPLSRMLKCPYCSASLVHSKCHGKWVYWRCNTMMEGSRAACKGVSVPERIIIELQAKTPITEPMVVMEVKSGKHQGKKTKKNYRLIPVTQYQR